MRGNKLYIYVCILYKNHENNNKRCERLAIKNLLLLLLLAVETWKVDDG